uniref:hypothetical protein n=1 Tax=Streptosporangium sp. CA-235898 TaxID=3240073 RepID=UPI003F49745A
MNTPPPLTPQERQNLARDLIPLAMRLVGIVHEEGPDATAEFLAGLTAEQQYALPIILAAMVPDDRTPAELLGWYEVRLSDLKKRRRSTASLPEGETQPAGTVVDLQPCPSPAAYKRHLARGEQACDPCKEASRRYRQELYQTRKSRKNRRRQKAAA